MTRLLLRRIGDSADVLTYVSEWCRAHIAPALSPEAAGRMRPLSPGVDTDRFRPGCGGEEVRRRLGIPEHAPVVVCTARMVKRKGQDTLVRAWPSVLRVVPEARLLLVGDGPERGRLEGLARTLGVRESVLFAGGQSWTDMPRYTDAGDVFAMPCRTRRWGLEAEAFGIVFLEAQACGLPVVIGDSGGAPETLASGGPGRVVDPRSPSETGAAVVSLLERSGPRAGRVAVLPPARTWSSVAERFRDLVLGAPSA